MSELAAQDLDAAAAAISASEPVNGISEPTSDTSGPMHDPTSGMTAVAPRTQHARTLKMACAVLIGITGLWTFWPLSAPKLADPLLAAKAQTTPIQTASSIQPPRPLDMVAFRTPLWVAPIPPHRRRVPAPPPPPLKLQLVAIVREGGDSKDPQKGHLAALLYDPDQGKLLTVVEGQTLQNLTIMKISESGVELRDQQGTRTLALKTDRAGGTP